MPRALALRQALDGAASSSHVTLSASITLGLRFQEVRRGQSGRGRKCGWGAAQGGI